MEYKVGMRVKCIKPHDDNFDIIGKMGRIVKIYNRHGNRLGIIEFDKKIKGGHSGCGNGKDGYCWNVPIGYVKPIDFKQRIK